MQSRKSEFEVQAELLINRGQRLADVLRQQGWQDVVAIINSVLDEATNDLLKEPPGTDAVVGLHAQARAARVIRDLTLDRIQQSIEDAKAKKIALEQQAQLAELDITLPDADLL